MEDTLLGIPLAALGLICLGIAALFYFIWPRDKTPEAVKQQPGYQPRPAWMQAILRWSHLLVWLLLAATCFLASAGQSALASATALLAGILYLLFVTTLMKDKQRQKAFEHESTAPPSNRQSGG
jgi:hypothetical protein